MSKKCNECGHNNDETAIKCSECGNIFPASQVGGAGKILGILSLIFWLLPFIGLPVAIVGLVISKTKGAKLMNVIGLALSVVNAVIGAIMVMGK